MQIVKEMQAKGRAMMKGDQVKLISHDWIIKLDQMLGRAWADDVSLLSSYFVMLAPATGWRDLENKNKKKKKRKGCWEFVRKSSVA